MAHPSSPYVVFQAPEWNYVVPQPVGVRRCLRVKAKKYYPKSNQQRAKIVASLSAENFEDHIDPNDPTNNCLDVAIITAPEKRTKKTIEKLNTIAGRALKKWKNYY